MENIIKMLLMNPKLFTKQEKKYDTLVNKYVGRFLGLYAKEDDFDQSICIAVRAKSIDIIILTDMIGSHQVVTEILDTRERSVSFKSLLYN